MAHIKISCFFLFLISQIPIQAFAQNNNKNKDFQAVAKSIAIKEYEDSRKEKLYIYRGTHYTGIPIHKGHPFFHSAGFESGSITYGGITYSNIPLLYDLVQDEVLILHHNNFYRIKLDKAEVSDFEIHGRKFIYIKPQNEEKLKPGFYEVLFEGESLLLKKHLKEPATYFSDNVALIEVKLIENYFLISEGKSINFTKKRALLKHFAGLKKEVKQHLKQQSINFKKSPDLYYSEAISFYDNLKNKER